ncbi:recombinase RecT [Paracoccus sp. SM22M-07]|uniref:recombinase RecT n=1 Tax=Paracoccus sp. SM22M-07 TaxID=1520813 RepID=UPI0009313B68|nr:recombinase RecT [Paracoccus sp. SM22M-07]
MTQQQSTSVATRPLRQVTNVKELLMNDMAKQQLATVAASHMKPDRMMRLMANAIRTTPQLGDCDPLSLLGSMMTCASLGVEPNTPLGHAYLLPFKNKRKGITEVQLILGYKGMIDLARRSGHVKNIHGDVVYESDDFSFEYGSNQHLTHRPRGKRENPLYAYCHATLTDGEAFVVLPWDEVMAIRDASQGYRMAVQYNKKDSPWIAHQHEMAAKTAVRALFKYLPISIEMDGGKLSDALSVDENRIDYTAFAKDPTAGHIEGEAYDVETGEVEEKDEAPAREEPKKEPAKKTTTGKPKAEEGEQGSMFSPSLSERIKMVEGSMKDMLAEGAPFDEVLEMFEAQIENIRAEDADEADALIEALRPAD